MTDLHAPHNVAQALAHAQRLGLERIDAQLLLLHALQRSDAGRAWLIAHDTDLLDAPAYDGFIALCQRRATGEPTAYLTGHKEFYGLALHVDARVLDPRPDTETLVDWALELMDEPPPTDRPLRVVDLGTGSGAIALALQHHCPNARVWAVDASADALAVAQSNAVRLGLAIECVQGNWLEARVGASNARKDEALGHFGPFDLIVSNPPYIAAQDPHLAALTHEPLQALASGADGLDDIRTIIAQAPAHLEPGGWLLLEHGYDQATRVQTLLTLAGLVQVHSRNDLAGIARCTGGRWPVSETVK